MLVELRRATRYPVHLDCSEHFDSAGPTSLSGQTVNMSSRGILVSFAGALPVTPRIAEVAHVVVELPQARYNRECWLHCACHVVRVAGWPEARMVALEVQRYHFRPLG